jgi:hypothetical protein
MASNFRTIKNSAGRSSVSRNDVRSVVKSLNGAVRDRSQVQNPQNDNWTKRDSNTGRFMDQKVDGKPFKGVRKEK